MATVPAKPSKPARKSLTIWLNTLAALAAIVATLDPSLFLALGPKAFAAVSALVAAANLFLRFRKEESVAE